MNTVVFRKTATGYVVGYPKARTIKGKEYVEVAGPHYVRDVEAALAKVEELLAPVSDEVVEASPDQMNRQQQQVLEFLKEFGTITKRDAQAFGCWNLPGRIHELRHEYGVRITSKREKHMKGTSMEGTHVRYVLDSFGEEV